MPSSSSAASVLGFANVGQQSGVHARMQRLDPAVEHLGETGELLHRRHRNTGARNGFGRRSGRDDGDARVVQTLGQLGKPGLVVHADQRASDRLAPAVVAHPMVAFRPVQVTPRGRQRGEHIHQQSPFDDLDPLVQGRLVVVVEHRDRPAAPGSARCRCPRRPDAPAAGDLDAVGQRVGHGVRAGKRRQQRRMGVDDTAREPRKKLRPKDFHESRRHHQVGLVCGGGVGDRRVPGRRGRGGRPAGPCSSARDAAVATSTARQSRSTPTATTRAG